MSVVIEIPEELTRYSGGQTEVEVPGATLCVAFESLFDQFPNLRSRVVNERGDFHPWILVFLDGTRVVGQRAQQTELNDGDRIEVAVLASGG